MCFRIDDRVMWGGLRRSSSHSEDTGNVPHHVFPITAARKKICISANHRRIFVPESEPTLRDEEARIGIL